MNIAIDAMGGDLAPGAVVKGVILAYPHLENSTITLIGDREAIEEELDQLAEVPSCIQILHAPEVIGMGDNPTKAFAQKPNSSIAMGFNLLKQGEFDVFCGAGNTGAMHVGAMFSVKPIEGITRPALISQVPKVDGSYGVLLDVGANTDCKPEVLHQFARLGSIYCQYVLKIQNPRVALMNLGEEEKKGNLNTQTAFQYIKADETLNFIGNVEGRDIFHNKADVLVCDGFVGNIILKMAESFYDISVEMDSKNHFFDKLNYESIGGSPILGINGNVVIGHGASSPLAIKNMILLAKKLALADLHRKFVEACLK